MRLRNIALLGRILAIFLAKIGGSSMKIPEKIEGESYLLGLPARAIGPGVGPLGPATQKIATRVGKIGKLPRRRLSSLASLGRPMARLLRTRRLGP